MAISESTQALIAAFSLLVAMHDMLSMERILTGESSGIVFNSATGAVFLYIKGHDTSLIRDGPRLALALFLLFSALWAQTDFIGFMINAGATTGCQVAITIASAFDQLARVSLMQFLLWGINSGLKTSATTIFPQAVILMRLVLGGVFVGFQRPQFKPVCVGRTAVLPLSISVLALDAFLIFVFLAKAFSAGLLRDIRESQPSTGRSKAIIFTTVGLIVWTAVSRIAHWRSCCELMCDSR